MKPNFQKQELIPAIIQDFQTKEILMLGFMNSEAFEKTLKEKRVTFFSRSKNRLWTKGETSNNFLDLIDFEVDCDQDTILIQAKPCGPTCHTGEYSCFKTRTENRELRVKNLEFIRELFELIKNRKGKMPEGSYTTSLFKEGLNKICVKVAEESGEVIKAATKESNERLAEESADLIFHLMVLLVERGVAFESLIDVFVKRNSK